MPKLIKLETSDDVSNYTPPSGYATLFYTIEDGKTVLKVKTSAGTIETVSGGSSEPSSGGDPIEAYYFAQIF